MSACAHVAAAGVLLWSVQPDPVPDQPGPETRLQMTAYQVKRSDAQERAPEIAEAGEEETGESVIASGSLALHKAAPLEASGSQVADLAPSAPSAVAQSTSGTRAEQAAAVPAQRIGSRKPATVILAAASPTPDPDARMASLSVAGLAVAAPSLSAAPHSAAALRKESPPLPLLNPEREVLEEARQSPEQLPSATPAAQPADSAAVPQQEVQTKAPDSTAIDLAQPDLYAAADLALPALSARASLAFPGSGDGPVDPVSLAAFQSFMQPGDLKDEAADIKDGIAGLMEAVPCSRLQVRFDPEAATLILSGHIPEEGLRGSVLSALQERMGASIPVQEDLLILPRPQCGALAGIARVGLPESTDQIANPLLVGKNHHARVFRYSDGQPLVLDLQGADYDAYLYVDYFDAAGSVLHLMPNEYTPMERTPAETSRQIGSERALKPGEPGLFLRVGPPYGQEIAVAFAASAPLYEGVRPLTEPAGPYLGWLEERVAEARAQHADFKGEWVYFFVATSAE
ncbi:MAG: DUF4384 domain-containing protein [Sulfitobacter sp.]|nr:DUF4384 domain-containing protein [Sulfitobacter sp.]